MISYKKCAGCGIELQTIDEKKIGYINDLKQDYCYRCFRITNYNQIIEYDLEPIDFLNNIKKNNAIKNHYFYFLDIYDLDGSRNLELEKIIQNNKITIVVNKIDIVNKLISDRKIIQYVENMFVNSKIAKNIQNIILVSALKNYALDELYQYIKYQKEDLYFIGCSNTGKSTLINSLIKLTKQQQKITVSAHFATTLSNIEINLATHNKIYDTPGIANYQNIVHYVSNQNFKTLVVNKLLRPATFQLNDQQTIFYEGLASFSYVQGDKCSFHFYTNNNIILHRTKYQNSENYFINHVPNQKLILSNYHDWKITKIIVRDRGEYSLFISGLGWITFDGIAGQILEIGTNANIQINLRKKLV